MQNLFDQIEPEYATPKLKATILKSAPSVENNIRYSGLFNYLWPFGSLWRPAAGFIMAAVFGVILGLTDPVSISSSNDIHSILIEDVTTFAITVNNQMEGI